MQFELVASAATDGLTGGVALPADIVYRCRALDRRLMNRWSLSAPFADEPKLLGITMLDEAAAVAQTPRLAVQAVPRWERAGAGDKTALGNCYGLKLPRC